ncbi:MAG: hypothetical protein D6725_02610 [Planctomycetota bacterium]|nr:MAG: hypothetical protein D6725_02610 [Planctomycetota bacterium]
MEQLLHAILQLVLGLWQLVIALLALVLPWTPLIAWIAFWTFAVDWTRLRDILLRGGWVVVALIALMAVLVWGTLSPPPQGTHSLLGLTVGNYAGKFVYVAGLVCLMFICGSVQLSGCCARCCPQPATEPETVDHHG